MTQRTRSVEDSRRHAHDTKGLRLGLAVRILEIEIIHALVFLPELRGSNVHADLDLAGVASVGDSLYIYT